MIRNRLPRPVWGDRSHESPREPVEGQAGDGKQLLQQQAYYGALKEEAPALGTRG